jgi:hypothetical protein
VEKVSLHVKLDERVIVVHTTRDLVLGLGGMAR